MSFKGINNGAINNNNNKKPLLELLEKLKIKDL